MRCLRKDYHREPGVIENLLQPLRVREGSPELPGSTSVSCTRADPLNACIEDHGRDPASAWAERSGRSLPRREDAVLVKVVQNALGEDPIHEERSRIQFGYRHDVRMLLFKRGKRHEPCA
jgi:hypothetical protein